MRKETLNVEGMSCEHCVRAIEGAVKQLGAAGKVDLAGRTVTVEYDEAIVTQAAIIESIEDQGYDVRK